MSQKDTLKRRWSSLGHFALIGLVAGALTGCNYLLFAGYLIGGPPSIEPAFDSETGLSMTDKDVTVAVVCFAPTHIKFTSTNIDYDLAKKV
ncbi:MAG: hypothetical protein KDA84_29245, partial [Planctomycetaceae bacterium]|nr:hypothetical protein [Planctomycetaceae bacterium]